MKNLFCFFLLLVSSTLGLEPSEQLLITSDRSLTPVLYPQILNVTDGNFMYSTFSLELVLLFLEAGAKGQTASEILSALQLFLVSNEALANGTKALIPRLTRSNKYVFNIANALFVQDKYKIKDDFLRNATEVFYAKVQNVNFTDNVNTANIINSWVEQQTNNKIQNLVAPNNFDAATRLVLVNTLYFKANFTVPFPIRYSIQGENFYKTSKDVVQVDMMVLGGKTFEYLHCTTLKAEYLKLPLNGKNASLVIVLPTEREGLADLEKHAAKVFTPRALVQRAVDVRLPKFTITTKIDFNSILKQIGMKIAFTGQADLSGIAGNKGDLSVSEVTQKTYIGVAEGGVEAAAATAATVHTTAVQLPPPNPVNFTCNHPFIFYIEVESVIIFSGRVVNPNQSA